MAKEQANVRKLAGRRVFFQGKFKWGAEGRLRERAKHAGATISKALDAKVDYLVLPDLASGKGVQQKAMSLNAKGAAIQVIDGGGFSKLTELSSDELLSLIRAGSKKAEAFNLLRGHERERISGTNNAPSHIFLKQKFDGLDLSNFDFEGMSFEECSFVGANLENANFDIARRCDFSRARSKSATSFLEVTGCRFAGAELTHATFEGRFDEADFTGAKLTQCSFDSFYFPKPANRKNQHPPITGAVFRKAKLARCDFERLGMASPDFAGADVADCRFQEADLSGGDFSGATLKNTILYQSKVAGGNFARADLAGANLAEADLSSANFAGANLAGANLRGAKTAGVDFSKAKNHSAAAAATGGVGPALAELDAISRKARRIEVTFNLSDGAKDIEVSVGSWGKQDAYARVPYSMDLGLWRGGKQTFATAFMQLANALGHWNVRFESVKVKTTKSPKSNKEVRELVLKGIEEGFAQSPPDQAELDKATKAHRDQEAKKSATEKKKRQAAQKAYEKRQQAAKAKAIANLTAKAGKVSDIDSFMKAIEVRTDTEKVKKATKMLKASSFQLFNDVTDTHLNGVVKSQTDPDLVYACRVDMDGHYACCTQNLNICGGLRGSICKHLLVLIIGLVKAGQLDPTTIDEWVAKTAGGKPELDKEIMGDIFIRYKGAEAGEVDWRPTETVPEDYYAM